MEAVQQALAGQLQAIGQAIEDQVDAELHRMENMGEDDLEKLREKRIDAMKRAQKKREEWRQAGHGEVRLIDGDKDFFKEAKCERFVCHFFRENNWPCKVMDKHLNEMAPLHLETKFARINAEKAPFVTEKLRIWMLPSLAVCKDGKIIDYIVGFDELGGSDDFPMSRLRMAIAARGGINWDGDDGPKAPPPPGGEKEHVAPSNLRRGGASYKNSSDESSDFSD